MATKGGSEIVAVIPSPGPLGLSLSSDNAIVVVSEGGQAAAAGVLIGDSLTHVAGAPCAGLDHDAVLGLIRAAERPLALTFLRAPAPAADAPKAGAVAAKSLARAGTFMKGLLSTGAQVLQGVEKVIDKVVDDSAKQAKVRNFLHAGGRWEALISLDPPPHLAHLLSAAQQAVVLARANTRRLALSDAALNLRALASRDGAFALTEDDARFEGVRAFMEHGEGRLALVRAGNDASIKMCVRRLTVVGGVQAPLNPPLPFQARGSGHGGARSAREHLFCSH